MLDRDSVQHTSVYLPKHIHAALRMHSLSDRLTMSELIVRALEGRWDLKDSDFASILNKRAAKAREV